MNQKKAVKAFKKIATREGVSVAEVRKEIQKAIDIGLASPDPAVQEQWSKMPHRGEKPTPEEVVVYLAKRAKSK